MNDPDNKNAPEGEPRGIQIERPPGTKPAASPIGATVKLPNAPWWRHDSNLENDNRFSKLRARLKADPYGLICRLYDFCASNQRDGQLALVDDDVLAHRLRFEGTGGGKQLRKFLKESGYLDRNSYVVEWEEELFRLYRSKQLQQSDRGKKSAAARALNQKQDITERGEDITATVERPVERSVELPLSSYPFCLTDSENQTASIRLKVPTESVPELYQKFCTDQRPWLKKDHPEGLSRNEIPQLFCTWCENKGAGKREIIAVRGATNTAASGEGALAEPEGWSEKIKGHDGLGNFSGWVWANIQEHYQKQIIKVCD